jgi:hypothetical protein
MLNSLKVLHYSIAFCAGTRSNKALDAIRDSGLSEVVLQYDPETASDSTSYHSSTVWRALWSIWNR